jgi:pimeloyl-ACP methyl ester carboxylesterase
MTSLPQRSRINTRKGLATRVSGSGRPIVFLHGWCLSGRMWMYSEEALAAHFEVIVPDLAGFGLSDALAGPNTLDRHADDILDLLSEYDRNDVVLVGFAFGAAVAMTAAARDASRIRSVVSVGIPSAACSPYAKFAKAIRRDWPDFAHRSAEALCANPQSAATLHWIEAMFAGTALPVAIEALGQLEHFEPEPLACRVPVQTLYVHADKDTVAPQRIGEACVAAAPNARLSMVENCGHLIVIDQKDAFNALLLRYLNTL